MPEKTTEAKPSKKEKGLLGKLEDITPDKEGNPLDQLELEVAKND